MVLGKSRDTTSDELTAVLREHNYDMLSAYYTLRRVQMVEETRARHRKVFPALGLGITAFSAYNVSRIGVLTGTGKVAAMLGMVVGPILLSDLLRDTRAPMP